MKKNVLLCTNFLVCTVIVIGFMITAYIGYRSNQGIFREDMEQVSVLSSQGIYHQIDSIFTKPINISLTMANDSLLKEFLEGEKRHTDDKEFLDTMSDYLNAYRDKYHYDSVFLASVDTKKYYYFNGFDRILEEGDPENEWFYSFLEQEEEYGIAIDNDEVAGAGNEVTIFINCRIKGEDGETMGVVGVGFRVDSLQSLLKSYESKSGIQAYLVNHAGTVEISTERTGFEGEVNFFDTSAYSEYQDRLLDTSGDQQDVWYSSQQGSGFVVSRYISNLGWHLIVENDTTALDRKLTNQLMREICIVIGTVLLVLITITNVIRRYNKKIIELTVSKEQAHRNIFQTATEQLYENIYEIDITHSRAASEATEGYFESLGAPSNIPYDEALKVIAEKQIKEEFRQGYLDMFCPNNVLKKYEEGVKKLQYDFMISNDGEAYYWMRITAQVFFWAEDSSVRMMVYRQNIDEEKRRELYMWDQMRKDSLTDLYNKAATQEHICDMLKQNPGKKYAFFILDIDNFKNVNDTLGHSAGDEILVSFAHILKTEFWPDDVAGRIGGDEFIVFIPVSGRDAAKEKAKALSAAQCREIKTHAGVWRISASIGVAVAPDDADEFEALYRKADYALYQTKRRGKNGYTVYHI